MRRKRSLILVPWILFLISSFLLYSIAESYHEGFQYIPPEKFLAQIIPIGDKYVVEYLPNYPQPGDSVLLYIKIKKATGETQHCDGCIVTGYFIGDDGVKNYLFENETLSDEGIKFTYPGKQVITLVKHEKQEFRFFVPLPSLSQSFIEAVYNYPILFMVQLITGIISIGHGIVFLTRKFGHFVSNLLDP